MAGTKGGKGGPKREAKAGSVNAPASNSGTSHQRAAREEEAQRQRQDLICRYLLQRLQADEAAAGDAAEGSASGGGSHRQPSSAAFLRLLAESSVRQADVRPAIRRAARDQALPQKKIKLLESVESRLAKHGPVLYQNASVACSTPEWQQGRVPERERSTEDPARFEMQLEHFELKQETIIQKLLEEGRQSAIISPPGVAASALEAVTPDLRRLQLPGLRMHPSLWGGRIPSPSELAAPPSGPDAAVLAKRAMLRLADELLEELGALQRAAAVEAATGSSARVRTLGGLSAKCRELDAQIAHVHFGSQLTDDVMEAVEPSLWSRRISALLQTMERPAMFPLDAQGEPNVDVDLMAAVRGHCLMQTQLTAAAEGWHGAPAELQRLLRPLVWLADGVPRGDASALGELLVVACSLVKVDAEPLLEQLITLRDPADLSRGITWRAAVLLLPLLAAAPPPKLLADWGGSSGAAAADASDGVGERHLGSEVQSGMPQLSPASDANADASDPERGELRAAATRLVAAERQRGLAAAILLALGRMQLRWRLYDGVMVGLARFVQNEGVELSNRPSMSDLLLKLSALPPDSLLLAYCYVAIMFGRAFTSPDELGGSAGRVAAGPAGQALGWADFALASQLCCDGGLAWEPQASSGGSSGSGGGAAGEVQLCLRPHCVESVLHGSALAELQKQQQEQEQNGPDDSLLAVPRCLTGVHCDVGWCSTCRGLLPPDAPADASTAALAALAAGSGAAVPMMRAALALEGGAIMHEPLELLGRLFKDEPLLAGTPSESTPDILMSHIQTLHTLNSAVCVADRRLQEVTELARDSLIKVEMIAGALAARGDHPLPLPPHMLKQLAESSSVFVEIVRRVHVAQLLLERLQLLAHHHRLQEARELTQRTLSADGQQPFIMLALEDSLQTLLDECQQRIAFLSRKLENPRESAKWAMQLGITLNVLHAGAVAHEKQQAASTGGLVVPYLPPKSLYKNLEGPVGEMREITRYASVMSKRLESVSTMLHLRSLNVIGQLRRLCAVNLLLPLEVFVLQHMLAPRWEKEAAALLGEGSGAGSAAAEQAAAEEAARLLLEEESAQEEAERRRRQQKEERQRAAEQKRLAELEQRRRAEQDEQRQAEAERRRVEEEESVRQRAAKGAGAAEEARRQQAAAHAAALQAAFQEGEEEEEDSDADEEGGTAAGERARRRRSRGGAKSRQMGDTRLARDAASAPAVPGPAPLPSAAQPSRRAAAPPAAPAAAAVKQGPAAAAAAAAAAHRSGAAQQQAQQQPRQQAQQQPRHHAAQQPIQPAPAQHPASPHDRPLAHPSSSGSVGGAGARSAAAGCAKQARSAAAGAPESKPRVLTVTRPKAQQAPAPQAASAAGARAAGKSAPAAVGAVAPPATAAAVRAEEASLAAQAPAARPAAPAAVVPAKWATAAAEASAAPPAAAAPSDEVAAAAPAHPPAGLSSEALAAAPVPSTAGAAPAAAAAAAATSVAAAPAPAQPAPAAAEPSAKRLPAGPVPGSWAALAAKKPAVATTKQQAAPAGQRQPDQAQQAQQAPLQAAPAAEPPAAWPGFGGNEAAAVAVAPSTPELSAAAAEPVAADAALRVPSPAAAAEEAGSNLRSPPPSATAPSWGSKPGLNFLAALAPEQAEVAMLALPGLRNEAGEFNCFLNVVVQCLWRCTAFRSKVLDWAPQVYRGDAVIKALHGRFCELTAIDLQSKESAAATAAAAGGGAPPRQQRPVIDPTPLREALNALPSQEFKKGEMSDAGELLLVLYEHIKGAAPAAAAAAAVDQAFGLHIAEAVRCQKCGRVTQETNYTQHFHNVPAATLRNSLRAGTDPGFGARLRALEDAHQKTCDTDAGGCGSLWPVNQQLQDGAPPRVFTLQLVWDSHNQEPAAIGATLRAVGETVDLSQLYAGVPAGARYRLRSLACYYGRHYSAFVRLPELNDRWVMFDDASASAIGSWSDVRRLCQSGRIQPSVLFYEAESEQ